MTEAVPGDAYTLKQVFPRLLKIAAPHWRALLAGFLCLSLGSVINLAFPYLIKLCLNEEYGIVLSEHLGQVVLFIIGLFALQSVIFYYRHLIFHAVGARVVRDIRQNLYNSMLAQDISFFDSSKVGDLLNRLALDTELLQSAVTVNISISVRYALQVLGGIILMILISPYLTLMLVLAIPLVIVGGIVWGKKLKSLARYMQDKLGDAASVAEESLGAVRTVRVFSGEEFEKRRYGDAVTEAMDAGIQRAKFAAMFSSSMVFLMHSAIAGILFVGASMVFSNSMSVGDLTAFLLYGVIVAVSFGFLAGAWDSFMLAAGASERIFSIIDSLPTVSRPQSPASLKNHKAGKVEFDNVSFSYPTRSHLTVLEDLSFSINEGETVALVGPSGGGKTTIASMIPRFYDPSSGSINYMGENLKDLDPDELRSYISIVQQEPQIFSVSIRENILYSKRDASEDELINATKVANLYDFISSLPEGFDTLVGDRGIQLSGGEKQRLAIARAVLKNPSFLILDEATSSLDSENERLVQNALEKLMEGRTSLVIAHRLSTVQHADKVLTIQNGQITQQGTHSSLVQEEGLYKTLVEHQLL